MEFRQLGKSGLQVPVLCFGTGTFGGGNEFFKTWGSTDVDDARELVDTCMDAGVNFFDTADVYSPGAVGRGAGRGDQAPAARGCADLDQDDVCV